MITTSQSSDRRGVPVEIGPARRLIFGGDYNPEQWPEEVWAEDIQLMEEAGVTTVTLGVFSWAALEPADGVFAFEWLDRIMALLHEAGIGVTLATPTAAPPMWLIDKHPEIMTVDANGVTTSRGGRLGWSPSSTVFRQYALRMVRALANHVAGHPGLVLWHVSNELGNENASTFDADTAEAFRTWLSKRHGSIGAVNTAWGTSFWGHTYPDLAHVHPPRAARTSHNPGLLLDWARFTSDALLAHHIAEREVLREVTPDIPVTTNFMVMGSGGTADYERWALEVDVVSNDHYTRGADARRTEELSFSAARTRGMSGGGAWLLMEHATSAVSWQGVNLAKTPGEMMRESLAHVAHGADGVSFFQWRQSRSGAEQWHSAMVPHAGADSRIFREVTQLGQVLSRIDVVGSRVKRGNVALLWDQQSVWALDAAHSPNDQISFQDVPLAVHAAATRAHLGIDVVPVDDDWGAYPVVVIANMWLAGPGMTERVDAYVRAGGRVIITARTGMVDQHGNVVLGGYPGAYRDTLGVRVDEVLPLLAEDAAQVDGVDGSTWSASHWVERVTMTTASPLATWRDGPCTGLPAVTIHRVGHGEAVYVATLPDWTGWVALISLLSARWELRPEHLAPPQVEIVTRVHDTGASTVFLINHGNDDATVDLHGHDAVTDAQFTGRVPGGAVAVITIDRKMTS